MQQKTTKLVIMGARKYAYYIITHSSERFKSRREAEIAMASHGRTSETMWGKRISDGVLVEIRSKY